MIKKYKLLYSLLLISLVGTMVTVSRWKAWFYIPPEQSYAVPQTPDRKYKVDMVVAGHDHCYMQRNTDDTTPVYIDCNSSDKFYLSNCNLEAARICCAHCMYHYVEMTDSTLLLKSYVSDRNRLYDDAVICKSNDKNQVRVISHVDRISELLDIPPHTDKSNLKVFLRMRERRIRHAAHATRNAFQISPRR